MREVFGAHPRKSQFLPSAQRSDAVAAAIDLSDAEAGFRLELPADRPHHARQSNHRVLAAARHRRLHRPAAAAALARRGHGVYARRYDAARIRPEFRRRSRRRRAHRAWICRLPSRVVSNRAARVGRAPWIRAGILPGRRKRRIGRRPAARGVFRAAVRTTQHRVVFADGAAGNRLPLECRQLVQADRRVQCGRRRDPGKTDVADATADTGSARVC